MRRLSVVAFLFVLQLAIDILDDLSHVARRVRRRTNLFQSFELLPNSACGELCDVEMRLLVAQ